MSTVREATYDVLRSLGMTTISSRLQIQRPYRQ